MTGYEYRVIPAPTKGRKAQGIKGAEARFAHALQEIMNEEAAGGWEYQRSDILPSEERQGLTSSHTVYRSVLVFRRVVNNIETGGDTVAQTPEEPEETPDISEGYEEPTGEPDTEDSQPERP